MTSRSIRVNELVKREISQVLHTDYKDESVAVTITEVWVAPDLRRAKIFYSVLGDAVAITNAKLFFSKNAKLLRYKISKNIVLKYLPKLRFCYDDSIKRGNRVIELLDDLD